MTYLNDGATTAADDFRAGRLAGHLDGFETLLGGQGYVAATVRQKIDLLADFSAWGRGTTYRRTCSEKSIPVGF